MEEEEDEDEEKSTGTQKRAQLSNQLKLFESMEQVNREPPPRLNYEGEDVEATQGRPAPLANKQVKNKKTESKI